MMYIQRIQAMIWGTDIRMRSSPHFFSSNSPFLILLQRKKAQNTYFRPIAKMRGMVSRCPILYSPLGPYKDHKDQEYLEGERPFSKKSRCPKHNKRAQKWPGNSKNAKNRGLEYRKSMLPHRKNIITLEYQLLIHHWWSSKPRYNVTPLL